MKSDFIKTVKTLQKKVGRKKVMTVSMWLELAHKMQRNASVNFSETTCSVDTGYSGIYEGKYVEICVSRYNDAEREFSLYRNVRLYDEHGYFPYEWECQRKRFNEFCDKLTEEV